MGSQILKKALLGTFPIAHAMSSFGYAPHYDIAASIPLSATMRLALISDIHANAEALGALSDVLASTDEIYTCLAI